MSGTSKYYLVFIQAKKGQKSLLSGELAWVAVFIHS